MYFIGGNPADILQFLGLDVVDAEDCKEIYKDKGAQITPGPQMCAGGVKGQDSCVGDSGSALMRVGKEGCISCEQEKRSEKV